MGRPSLDPQRTIGQAWKVLAPPQTFFIDRDGIIRASRSARSATTRSVDGMLASILG